MISIGMYRIIIEEAWSIPTPSMFNRNNPEASLTNNPPKLIGRVEIRIVKGTAIINI